MGESTYMYILRSGFDHGIEDKFQILVQIKTTYIVYVI